MNNALRFISSCFDSIPHKIVLFIKSIFNIICSYLINSSVPFPNLALQLKMVLNFKLKKAICNETSFLLTNVNMEHSTQIFLSPCYRNVAHLVKLIFSKRNTNFHFFKNIIIIWRSFKMWRFFRTLATSFIVNVKKSET